MSSTPQDNKSDARDFRLKTVRKANEEVLRREYQDIHKAKCKSEIVAFGDCAKSNGLMVVLRCRGELKMMNDCMDIHISEEGLKEYLKDKFAKADAKN